MNENFIFYSSYWEAIKDVPQESKLRLLEAIVRYGCDGEIPELDALEMAVFQLIAGNIDANHAKREQSIANGKKGGRPSSAINPVFNTFWSNYPNQTDKAKALQEWENLNPDSIMADAIINGLSRSKKYDPRFKNNKLTPQASNWLKERGWQSSFDTDSFFDAAVANSYKEDIE